jgi:hypothetical protein
MPFEGPGELPPREVRAPIPGDWDEYLAAVVRWLERHWRDQRCPRCREDRWRIQPVVGLVVAAEPWPRPQQQRGQDAALASIPVTCTTCSRVELVNAFYVFRLPP